MGGGGGLLCLQKVTLEDRLTFASAVLLKMFCVFCCSDDGARCPL